MKFARLEVSNVRIVESAVLEPSAALNVLLGENGSGKTSVLEAAYLVSAGKSFRAGRVGEMIRKGAEVARVVAHLERDDGTTGVVGVERGSGRLRARIDGRDATSASELAKMTPVVAMTPDAQRIYTDGAEERRRVVDWVMFHVEPAYGQVHAEFRKVLRQRNALLRSPDRAGITVWDEAVVTHGEALHLLRTRHLEAILTGLSVVLSALVQKEITLEFQAGFDSDKGLLTGLRENRRRDEMLGYTSVGPHRCDLSLIHEQKTVQSVLSRGEGKMLAASLLIAQGEYLEVTRGVGPAFVIDDLAAELDERNRDRLMSYLRSKGWQALMSTVDDSFVEEALRYEARVFHVKQGELSVLLQ